MGKKAVRMSKKKSCGKYRKKNAYCKRCPVKIRMKCQLNQRGAEMGKKKDDKKDKKKACCKKSCKDKSKKKDKK